MLLYGCVVVCRFTIEQFSTRGDTPAHTRRLRGATLGAVRVLIMRGERRGRPFLCLACGHRWVKRCSARAFSKHSPRCPQCGARDASGAGRTYIPAELKPSPWRLYYESYLVSGAWAQLRRLVIDRDGGACRSCRDTANLHVHHLHYLTLGRETGEELVTFCKVCHAMEHRHALRDRISRWRSNPVRGDAQSTWDRTASNAPFQGESSQYRSGSVRTEAAGLAGRDEARNSPSSQAAIAPA